MKVDETGAQRVALGLAPNGGDVAPVTTANPVPVSLASSGTGANAQQVQGTAAEAAAANTTNPVKTGGVVSVGTGSPSVLPNVAAAGQNTSQRYTPQGAAYSALVDGGGFILTTNYVGGDSVAGFGPALKTYGATLLTNGTTLTPAPGDASGAFVSSAIFWTEASANQAAAATLTGTLRANGGVAGGVGTRFEWFVAEAFADVAGGTLYIDKSIDGGTTWRQVGSIACVAGTSVSLRVPITAASYRARHVNGANATTAFLLTSGYQT